MPSCAHVTFTSSTHTHTHTSGKVIGKRGDIIQVILEKSKVNNVRVVGDEEAKQRNLDISAQVCGCVVRVCGYVVREGVCGYRGREADVWMCDVHFLSSSPLLQVPFDFIGRKSAIENAKMMLEYHLDHLKVRTAPEVSACSLPFLPLLLFLSPSHSFPPPSLSPPLLLTSPPSL